MKAAVLRELNRPLEIEDVDFDGPREGEVVVRIFASGVCHSCYHAMSGNVDVPRPIILGDEGAGIVEDVGTGVKRVKRGDHVILSWARSCGYCTYCTQGYPAVCLTASRMKNGYMADGTTRYTSNGESVYHFGGISSFGEYTVISEESAVPIDEDIPLDKAALVGCSVTTGVCAVTNTAEVRAGSSVAVFGVGGIGLNVVQGSVLCGAEKIIAVDPVISKLKLAMQFGATHTVNAGESDPVSEIQALTEGLGADYAFESIGTESTYIQSVQSIRTRGKAIWIGAPPREPISLDARAVFSGEKMVMGSNYGSARPLHDMPRLLALYKSGRLKLDELVTQTYRIQEINEAFTDMLEGRLARGLVLF